MDMVTFHFMRGQDTAVDFIFQSRRVQDPSLLTGLGGIFGTGCQGLEAAKVFRYFCQDDAWTLGEPAGLPRLSQVTMTMRWPGGLPCADRLAGGLYH